VSRTRAALGTEQLRSSVRELHPYLLDHLDLPSAVQSIAEQHAGRGGYRVSVDIEQTAVGIHDRLIVALIRELLTNATKHADAASVDVRLVLKQAIRAVEGPVRWPGSSR
jgi:signal transduction histidine kinase